MTLPEILSLKWGSWHIVLSRSSRYGCTVYRSPNSCIDISDHRLHFVLFLGLQLTAGGDDFNHGCPRLLRLITSEGAKNGQRNNTHSWSAAATSYSTLLVSFPEWLLIKSSLSSSCTHWSLLEVHMCLKVYKSILLVQGSINLEWVACMKTVRCVTGSG